MLEPSAADVKELAYSRNAEVPSDPEGLEPSIASAEDAKDMYRLGKQQEFKRNFRFVSIAKLSISKANL